MSDERGKDRKLEGQGAHTSPQGTQCKAGKLSIFSTLVATDDNFLQWKLVSLYVELFVLYYFL